MKNHLFLLFLLTLASCNKSIFQPNTPKMLTYLALGDSYTIGESVAETDRFPVKLSAALTKAGIHTAAPDIIAKTGWTTDELKAKIIAENKKETYDIVTLLIGVNNQYRGRSATEYRSEFVDLLATAIQFAKNNTKHVTVISIPDWGVTPFAANRDRAAIATQIDAFNAIAKEEADKKDILYVDITDISRQATNDPTLIADDGLHPSGKMYQLWVDRIAPLFVKIFKN